MHERTTATYQQHPSSFSKPLSFTLPPPEIQHTMVTAFKKFEIGWSDTLAQSYNGYSHSGGGGYGGGGGGGGWGGHDDRMSNLGGGLRSVDWQTAKLEVFEKNFYIEDKKVSARPEREIEEFRRTKEIKVNIFLHAM